MVYHAFGRLDVPGAAQQQADRRGGRRGPASTRLGVPGFGGRGLLPVGKLIRTWGRELMARAGARIALIAYTWQPSPSHQSAVTMRSATFRG
jgi:hypothetical protein